MVLRSGGPNPTKTGPPLGMAGFLPASRCSSHVLETLVDTVGCYYLSAHIDLSEPNWSSSQLRREPPMVDIWYVGSGTGVSTRMAVRQL